MELDVSVDAERMGRRAAERAAASIGAAIERRGEASIVVATGASQLGMLAALVEAPGIDWSRVDGFHLDEYIGLSMSHPASFRRYLKERFVDRVPLRSFEYIDGEADPETECDRLSACIGGRRIDAAMIGIGENGHIAFNDPPADFETDRPYIVVELDEACRRQQLGEGWFGSLDEVPGRAISMSCRQILAADSIVCTVPDRRKAEAVRDAVEGPVTPDVPGSILQRHGGCTLFLDDPAASLLSGSQAER